MQTKPFLRLSIAVMLLSFLASCHKSNKQGRLVPNDAAAVMVVDGNSLSAKLSWDDIKQNPQFQQMLLDSTTPANIRSILNNPDSSGIDIKSDLIFFVEKDSAGGGYVGLEGTVKDPTLFRNFHHQIDSAGTESQVDDITFISHYPSCIGWNKEKFVLVFDAPLIGKSSGYSQRLMNDSINPDLKRDIGATCKSIFALDEKSSLAVNEKFTKLLKENGDIHFWINTGELYSQMFLAGPLSMLNLDNLYKDNVTTATLSFDNGKISLKSRSYMNDNMLAFYKKYVGDKINEDMIQRMPGKDVDGVVAVNFKPEGIKELLKQLGVDGMANGALSQLNLSIDDITSAFKGDVLFGASDFNIQVDSVDGGYGGFKMPKETTNGNFVFAASIGDKDAFNKILNTAKNLIAQQSQNGNVTSNPLDLSGNNGTYFVVTNTKENTAKYLAGTNTNFDFISNINEQPFGCYINIQSVLKGFAGVIDKDSASQALYDASLKMWNNIYMKGGSVDGDVSTGTFEINLVDNSTNSLKQLNQYIAKVSAIYKEKEAKVKAEEAQFQKADTSAVFTPDTSVAPPVKPTN